MTLPLALPGVGVVAGGGRGDHYNTPPGHVRMVRDFACGRAIHDPCHNPSSFLDAELTHDGSSAAACGLSAQWRGVDEPGGWLTFANVPYSRPLPWVKRAEPGELLMLVKSDHSVRWWQQYALRATAIARVRRRVVFYDRGSPVSGNNFPSAYLYFGDRVGKLREVFDHVARVEVL